MRSCLIAGTLLLTACFPNAEDPCPEGEIRVDGECTPECEANPESEQCTPADADGDAFPAASDCDDNDAKINPGAGEECDGVDNDCDGEVDEGVQGTFFADVDGDGFGDPADPVLACEADSGYVPVDGDCDDSNAAIYPDAEELCDGVDNDCNEIVDDGLACDPPATGYGDCLNKPVEEACLDDEVCQPTESGGFFCSRPCTDVSECPAAPSGDAQVQCPLTNPYGCILNCGGGEVCPDGMVCAYGFTQQVCQWKP